MSKNRTPDNSAALLRARDLVAAKLAPITGPEKQTLVCMDLLEQKIGTPPVIFGLQLETVPNKIHGRAAVMIINDMTTDCPLRRSGLPHLFWMEISVLFKNPDKKGHWNNPGEEILSRYLHLQSTFLEAKSRLYEERKAAEMANQEVLQQTFLEDLKQAVPTFAVNGPLDETMLTRAEPYVFQDSSGAVFRLYFAPQKNAWRVRVVGAPTGHVLQAAVEQQTYVNQADLVLYTGEDETVVEGTHALPRQVREYLRAALRAMGKYAPAPEKVVEEVLDQQPELQDSALLPALEVESAATAEPTATEVFGLSALPEEKTGRRVPTKRAARLNGTRSAHI